MLMQKKRLYQQTVNNNKAMSYKMYIHHLIIYHITNKKLLFYFINIGFLTLIKEEA